MDKEYKIKLSFFEEENPFYLVIKNDYFNIAKRIKKIDKYLFLVFNLLQKQYEIHDVKNKHNTFVIGFNTQDKEILDLLNKSKDRNTIAIIRDEARKRDRYIKRKKEVKAKDNKDFIYREQVEILTK